MRTSFRTYQAFLLSIIIFTISLLPLNKVSSSPSVNQSIETAWVIWETGIPIQDLSQQASGLWAGGYKGGLFQWNLTQGPTSAHSVSDGLPGNDVMEHVVGSNGEHWVALMDGGLGRSIDGQLYTRVQLPEAVYDHVWDLAVHNNTLWIATLGDGVFRKSGEEWVHVTKSTSGLPYDDIYAAAVENDGTAWFGTIGRGIAALRGTTWETYTPPLSIADPRTGKEGQSIANQAITDIAFDSSGNKWFATDGSGVAVLDSTNTSWTIYNRSNSGLLSNFIHTVYIDVQGNYWFGTLGGGVNRLSADRTTWSAYTTGNSPLSEDDILSITMDENQGLWLASYNAGLTYYGPLPLQAPLFNLDPQGQPNYQPGKVKGYYLWQDPATYAWNLVWSGDGEPHSFAGELIANGAITMGLQTGFEPTDQVTVNANTLTINASEDTGDDRVRFTLDLSATELTIRLKIDDAYYPFNIHVGKTGSVPGSAPFRMTAPQPKAPIVTVGENLVIDEGSSVFLVGEYRDTDSPTGHELVWNLGNSIEVPDVSSVTQIYPDNGVFHPSFTVTDIHGLSGNASLQVTVQNVAPQADFYFDPYLPEVGLPVTFTGTFYDQGLEDTHTITWDFGDGTPELAGDLAVTHTFTEQGVYPVSLTIVDDDQGTATITMDVFVQAPIELIFEDDFESGDLSSWDSSQTDGGDLSVTSLAALVGSYSMKASINDAAPIFLTDQMETRLNRYRGRFYFDPNTMSMADGDAFTILLGKNDLETAVYRVEFGRSSSGYQISASTLDDNGVWQSIGPFPVTDQVHALEIDLLGAESNLVHNGHLTLWLDGTQLASAEGLDNDTLQVDSIDLGAVDGIDSGTSGTLYLDAYKSQKSEYIGLDPTAVSDFTVAHQDFISVTLAWPDSAIPEEGYYIDRSTDGENWQRIAVLDPSSHNYMDYGLARHTKYWYRLTAWNAQETSSKEIEIETGIDPK